jgi:hypothetical protein
MSAAQQAANAAAEKAKAQEKKSKPVFFSFRRHSSSTKS